MNQITMDGRILKNSENAPHNYTFIQGNEDKKSFLRMTLSTRKPGGKKDANGYAETFFFPVKAFGATAEHIHRFFGEGAKVVVSGELDMSDEYTSPEGKVYAPRAELIANRVWFVGEKENDAAGAANGYANTRQTNAKPIVQKQAAQRKTPF